MRVASSSDAKPVRGNSRPEKFVSLDRSLVCRHRRKGRLVRRVVLPRNPPFDDAPLEKPKTRMSLRTPLWKIAPTTQTSIPWKRFRLPLFSIRRRNAVDARAMTTAALEPTWTTTSFFPKTTTLPPPSHRRPSHRMPALLDSMTVYQPTIKTKVAIPTKKVAVGLPTVKGQANRDSNKKTDSSVVVVVAAAADVVAKET